jgi:hypothetical protein
MVVSGQHHATDALYPRGKDPTVPIVQETGWAPEPVWTQRLEENILISKINYFCCNDNRLDLF